MSYISNEDTFEQTSAWMSVSDMLSQMPETAQRRAFRKRYYDKHVRTPHWLSDHKMIRRARHNTHRQVDTTWLAEMRADTALLLEDDWPEELEAFDAPPL